jgi:hypothetical protein
MCTNSECRYYWEDCCTRNINEERIIINEIGICETFEKGRSEWYDDEEIKIKEVEEKLSIDEVKEFSQDYNLSFETAKRGLAEYIVFNLKNQ